MNWIRRLQRGNGTLTSDRTEMGAIAYSYFKALFESKGIENLDHILSRVSRRITVGMNQSLLANYIVEEVLEALNSIGCQKLRVLMVFEHYSTRSFGILLDDPWVLGNKAMNSGLNTVAAIIDSSTRKWKMDLIENTLTARDMDRNLCIPLSMDPYEDHIIWQGEPTGEYTICSGHKLLLQDS
ncbi:hypothetical protein J1N35_029286 [Gossypium stocksii]|uniref:Uncharacterized protein n=1 Tax=Gossypium stocksii TaxID=47602 RepID=A0A9D3ZSZ3_9ROSI|nr:hypothetical protein J1N35_029286 [Gossypium stocksii]